MNNKILLIYDKNLKTQCDKLPTMLNRASIVFDLLYSYNLLNCNKIQIANSKVATDEELKLFHTNEYINILKYVNNKNNLDNYEEELLKYGLSYDCPVLENSYDLVKTLAGGTITAAKFLIHTNYKIAINWFGGWHHAQENKAEGFCYINDIVIGINILKLKFPKVLYIDLDVHHGDGVQNAFVLTKNVLTLSFHNYLPGFYPGTGSIDDVGYDSGKYYSLNVPFLDGINNSNYFDIFSQVFFNVVNSYKPDAIVVQCGADILNGDPIGCSNVTSEIMGKCIKQVLQQNKPTIFLGGGGYNFANTARYWTYLTSVIANQDLEPDIPDETLYFTEYCPSYQLKIDSGNRKDSNTKEYLEAIVKKIEEYCKHIRNECII